MKRTGFSLRIGVFALAAIGLMTVLNTAVPTSSAAPAAVVNDQENPPQPPQGVSAADPGAEPPRFDGWCCPNCGAVAAGYKGRLHRPMLAMGERGGRGGKGGRKTKAEDAV